MNIEFGKLLYGSRSAIESLGENVGKVGIGISAARAGVMSAPKLSTIAKVFDEILMYPGQMSVFESEDGVAVELNGEVSYATEDAVSYTADWNEKNTPSHNLICDALFCMKTNPEMKGAFDEVITSGGSDKTNAFLFCDSYYFANAKNSVKEQREITKEEVTAGFRSGFFTDSGIKGTKPSTFADTTKKAKAKKAAKTEKSNFIQECKDGKYFVPYSWPEELKRFIKPTKFLDTFESTPEFEEIVKKISYRAGKIIERMDMGLTGEEAIGKDFLNIMLLGKPGTGKTTLAYALSAATGMPICTTAWNKHSDEEEEEGKTKIVDGKPTFCVTNALLFHEFGGIDVNEEINLADPSVTMGCLGQKLEYPFIVKKNGYEDVKRHPLNVVIATMNVGTNGSNPLNQALANRFKTPYILDDPTRETFINIIEKASGKSREICEWVYNAYEATCQYLRDPDVNEEEICQNLSIRTCLGAIENMEEGQTPVRALINSIVGAVAVVDVELARNLQREKIEVLPNPTFEF